MHLRNRPLRIVALALMVHGLSGCFSSTAPSLPPDFKFQSIDLFLSRTNLTDTEFEQLKADHGKLFVECGKIRRGRFIPQAQNVFPLEPQIENELTQRSWNVLQFADRQFDKPGDNSSLFDPGQATLNLVTSTSTLNLKTSLDAVSSKTGVQETAVYDLVSKMRSAAGGELCSNKTFYGIR